MSWSSEEEVHFYIQKLIEVGIDVPRAVREAAERLLERRRDK